MTVPSTFPPPTLPTDSTDLTPAPGYHAEDLHNQTNRAINATVARLVALLQEVQDISLTPGADGAPGPSAYEVAVSQGFVGTETEWLAFLQGADGDPGAPGAPGDPGAPGAPGASAYDIAVAHGFVGTEEDWLTSLVGPAGAAAEGGGLNPRGEYVSDTTYEPGDLVESVTGTYFCKATTTLPPDSAEFPLAYNIDGTGYHFSQTFVAAHFIPTNTITVTHLEIYNHASVNWAAGRTTVVGIATHTTSGTTPNYLGFFDAFPTSGVWAPGYYSLELNTPVTLQAGTTYSMASKGGFLHPALSYQGSTVGFTKAGIHYGSAGYTTAAAAPWGPFFRLHNAAGPASWAMVSNKGFDLTLEMLRAGNTPVQIGTDKSATTGARLYFNPSTGYFRLGANSNNTPGATEGPDAIAIGTGARATNQGSVAIGDQANATGFMAMCLGGGTAGGQKSTTLGVGSAADGDFSRSLAHSARPSRMYEMGVGPGYGRGGWNEGAWLMLQQAAVAGPSQGLTRVMTVGGGIVTTGTPSLSGTQVQVLHMPQRGGMLFEGEFFAYNAARTLMKSFFIRGAIARPTAANSGRFIGTPVITSEFADAGTDGLTIAVTVDNTNAVPYLRLEATNADVAEAVAFVGQLRYIDSGSWW